MEAEIEDADRYDLAVERILTKVQTLNKTNSTSQDSITGQNLNPNAQEFVNRRTQESFNRDDRQLTQSNAFHKLPKLSLPYFDGNLLKWQHFWDCFQSSIHENQTLTDVQKLTYLQNQLQGIAADCIEGLPLTSANYYQAVAVLKERFGQKHKVKNAFIQTLIDIPAPKSNVDSLRNFSDRIECSIRGLESLGTEDTTFGEFLRLLYTTNYRPMYDET